ncbi:MAG TPA: tetratricopeptide repeat protein [Thermoplasmata archaeon]|jgi:tetratricopeptide (TPR) repeat protein|nr:tetratricopeptide repeat protein [Thermoplasmata archaeon]
MASPTFIEFSSALVEAMGQKLDAAKPTAEGLTLRTSDGFLYSFLEDPNVVSLDTIRHLLGDEGNVLVRLVVLTPGHLPLAFSQEIMNHGGTLVEGSRFAELARQLGLETYLGEEPRPPPKEARRLLPSAQQLDGIVHRARTWLDWGVPALALRFYRHAADLKPGFLPAKVGIGRSLLGLGLVDDAERAFDEVLSVRPADVEARLGKAAVLGARARPKEEVAAYRKLLAEDDSRNEVRAHLLAALIEVGDWPGARVEIEALLRKTPEEPQLRFLHSEALRRMGEKDKGEEERLEARRLGLTFDRETALCRHLGLPAPEPPVSPESIVSTEVAPPAVPRMRPRRVARPKRSSGARSKRRTKSSRPGKGSAPASRAAPRKRK